jgi:hypothetical protein
LITKGGFGAAIIKRLDYTKPRGEVAAPVIVVELRRQ